MTLCDHKKCSSKVNRYFRKHTLKNCAKLAFIFILIPNCYVMGVGDKIFADDILLIYNKLRDIDLSIVSKILLAALSHKNFNGRPLRRLHSDVSSCK